MIFSSAILVAAVDHVNLGGDTGKIDGLFNCGVAAADDGNFLVAVEETVAGCAGGNAFALEFFFTGKTEILSAGAGSNNQSVASVVAVVADQTDRIFRSDELRKFHRKRFLFQNAQHVRACAA